METLIAIVIVVACLGFIQHQERKHLRKLRTRLLAVEVKQQVDAIVLQCIYPEILQLMGTSGAAKLQAGLEQRVLQHTKSALTGSGIPSSSIG